MTYIIILMELKKHQRMPIEFLKNNKGLILFHSTGSGKTLTAIYCMYQFDKDIIVVGPKSSKKAFVDNLSKTTFNASKLTFYSYKKIKMTMEKNMEIFSNKCVIIDEAHNLRSETHDNLMIIGGLRLAYKIVLLTATPVINYLNDLAVLVNIVKGYDVLPTEKHMFNNIYYDENEVKIINENILKDKLKNCISYYKQVDDENYPSFETKEIGVEMSESQLQEYVYYVKKVIYKDQKHNIDNIYDIDFHTLDKKKKNFFLMVTRQLSNSVNNEITPKIQSIFDIVKNGPFPAIIYSNFLKNGIYTIALLLEKHNITYKVISGNTSDDKINMIVNDYNNGKFNVLLISSAGSESLDLKNTRQIHIMEPHWNEGKITQVIGRAVRFKSHEKLPQKDRNVVIYRWISIFPNKILNESADLYLTYISKKKDEIFDKFLDLIKSVSIENDKSVNIGGYYKQYTKYKNKYLELKDLDKLIIHISGPSGSGKTTLGNKLKEKYGNKIIVKDIDDLRMEFISEYYGNKKWSKIDKVAYQQYIDDFIKNKHKPIIFTGLNNMSWWHKDHYYNMHSTYNFYIDIDDKVILKQKCMRLMQDIQTDNIAMDDLVNNNEYFMKKFMQAFKGDCNANENNKVNNKWKLDYKKQKYVFMSRENIYKRVCEILDKSFWNAKS